MMQPAWVIGQGGLLGSALRRVLHDLGMPTFTPPSRFEWLQPAVLTAQIQDSVQQFAAMLQTGQPWTIYWAAGQGNMRCSAEDLLPESNALDALLCAIDASPALQKSAGVLTLASSAGAIYANSTDEVISESSLPAANTPYAQAKLQQEQRLLRWAEDQPGRRVVMARLSTLYGPGQARGKQQGLISHLARQMLRQQPIHIFVPLGTLRDYIYADDAARTMIHLANNPEAVADCHIVASQRPCSIAEIVATFTRLTRRAPRIITSVAAVTSLYRPQMIFRSQYRTHLGPLSPTPLAVGVHRVLQSEVSMLGAGISKAP